jgi:hypothetical protein
VAIEDLDDANHTIAIDYRDKIREGDTPFRRLYTSNYVIDEALTLLRTHCGHRVVVSLRKTLEASRLLSVLWITESLEKAAWGIFEKHTDKEFSFTDCTSFALMEAEAIRNVFTFDQHFSQYGFESVP